MTIMGRSMERKSGHRKRRCFLLCTALTLAPAPLMAEPWVKSFVVDKYEPAFYYGGRPGVEKAGVIEPGVDCPGGTLPMMDFAKVVKTPWRSDEEVASWVKPAQVADLQTVHYMQERILTYRSFRRDIVSYLNPFTVPDPGMPSVVGKIAEGLQSRRKCENRRLCKYQGREGYRQRLLPRAGLYRFVPGRALHRRHERAQHRQDAGRHVHHGHSPVRQQRPEE